jgi:N utilization substance protein A
MAVLSNGRRCPNAAVPGSTYCGLPQHQALSRFETSQVAILSNVAEAELAILADPDADEGQVSEIVERAEAEFVEEEPTSTGPAEDTDGESVGEAEQEQDESEEALAEDAATEAPQEAEQA